MGPAVWKTSPPNIERTRPGQAIPEKTMEAVDRWIAMRSHHIQRKKGIWHDLNTDEYMVQ